MRLAGRSLLRGVAATVMALAAIRAARAQMWERVGPPGGDVISLAAAGETELFLGTADGHVFASKDAGEHWELRGRVGLPAAASWGGWIGDELWMISMRAGGTYVSRTRGKNWDRQRGAEEGEVIIVEEDGGGRIWAATRTDGVLVGDNSRIGTGTIPLLAKP